MTQSILKGGCLCGAVRYEVTGEAKRFFIVIALAAAR